MSTELPDTTKLLHSANDWTSIPDSSITWNIDEFKSLSARLLAKERYYKWLFWSKKELN